MHHGQDGGKHGGFQEIDDNDQLKRTGYFVYADENHERLHYPSMESDDDAQLKASLIRQNVKEGQKLLDGPLIQKILEDPKTAQMVIKYEPVLNSIRNLDRNISTSRLNASEQMTQNVKKKTTMDVKKTSKSSKFSPNMIRPNQRENNYSMTMSGYEGDHTGTFCSASPEIHRKLNDK